MAAEADDPVIKALPPVTDYITYLTILEYQLTPARLPSLYTVLQDGTLTENIGWDLVHLLVPMLPASRECLDVIARKGNPREVIIRVTELLASMGHQEHSDQEESDNDLPTFEGEAERIHLGDMVLDGMAHSQSGQLESVEGESRRDEVSSDVVWTSLLSMLSVLHSRIKTNSPSRFLATSLPATLSAYRQRISHDTTLQFLDFLGKLSGRRRPALPPRRPTTEPGVAMAEAPLPDPEAETLPQTTSSEEKALISRLLQAVLLEICEDYVFSLGGEQGGLSWSTRLNEKLFTSRIVPGRINFTEKYCSVPELKRRDSTMEKILELGLLLGLHPKLVLDTLLAEDQNPTPSDLVELDSPNDYPTKPADIPFSSLGSLIFLAAYQTASICHTNLQINPMPVDVFPTLATLNTKVSDEGSLATKDDAAVDALLAINLTAVKESGAFDTAPSFEMFMEYFRPINNLSADSPHPQWRNTSHNVATIALTSHPNESTRLQVVDSLLQEQGMGPLMLLKGSAIGWLKTEILSAQSKEQASSVFQSSKLIDRVFPMIFGDLSNLSKVDEEELSLTMAPVLSNAAVALNFYYFMASSPTMRNTFDLDTTHGTDECSKAVNRYIDDLDALLQRLDGLDQEIKESLHGEIIAIQFAIESIKGLNRTHRETPAS